MKNIKRSNKMIIHRLFLLIFLLILVNYYCFSQDEEKNSLGKSPNIMSGGDALANAFGGEIQLEVNADRGEIVSNISKDGKFSSMVAKVDVHLISEDIDLMCDKLVFEGKENILTAIADSGKVVQLKIKDIVASAGQFKYYIDKKRAELTINPKVSQGMGTNMSAPLIVIQQDEEGNTSVIAKYTTDNAIQKSPSESKIFVKYKPTKNNKTEKKETSKDDKETTGVKKITPDNIKNIPEKTPSSPKKEINIIEKF